MMPVWEKDWCISGWGQRPVIIIHDRRLKPRVRTHSSRITEHTPRAIRHSRWTTPNPPQDCFTGAAVLKRDHVANFMANVNIHFICDPQGELDGSLSVDLRAYHAAVLVVDGQAVLSTPLRNL